MLSPQQIDEKWRAAKAQQDELEVEARARLRLLQVIEEEWNQNEAAAKNATRAAQERAARFEEAAVEFSLSETMIASRRAHHEKAVSEARGNEAKVAARRVVVCKPYVDEFQASDRALKVAMDALARIEEAREAMKEEVSVTVAEAA